MIFTLLTIQNFLSFGEESSLRLDRRGLLLIEGVNTDDTTAKSNGAGKTSIIDALLWCLFDVTTRGVTNDDVVNRRYGRDCVVSVTVHLDAQVVLVRRYRKHREGKNGLYVEIDGVDRRQGTVKETQDFLNRLLGFTAQTFLNSVVFGQTAGYRFSRLTDKEQKAVLDEALGTAQYARACDKARKDARELETELDYLTRKMDDLKLSVDELRASETELQRKQDDFATTNARDIKTLAGKIDDTQTHLTDAKDALAIIDGSSVARIAKNKELRRATFALTSLTTVLGEAQAKLKHLQADERRCLDEIARVQALESKDCTMCGQLVTDKHIQAHVTELQERRAIIAKGLTRAADQATDIQGQIKAGQEKCDDLRKQIAKLDVQVATHIELTAKVVSFRDTLTRLRGEHNDAITRISPYSGLLETTRRRRRTAVRRLKKLRKIHRSLTQRHEQLLFWVEGFGSRGLRTFLIDTALPFLNERAAHYSNILTDGTIKIEFSTQSKLKTGKDVDRFDVIVTNTHGAQTYRGASAGETGKVDLCVNLALQSLVLARCRQTNIAFFDEPFEHIDEEGAERVIRAITTDVTRRRSVFVITHNEALKSYFADTVRVVKRRGVSKIEE